MHQLMYDQVFQAAWRLLHEFAVEPDPSPLWPPSQVGVFNIGTFGDWVACRTALGVAISDQDLRLVSER